MVAGIRIRVAAVPCQLKVLEEITATGAEDKSAAALGKPLDAHQGTSGSYLPRLGRERGEAREDAAACNLSRRWIHDREGIGGLNDELPRVAGFEHRVVPEANVRPQPLRELVL